MVGSIIISEFGSVSEISRMSGFSVEVIVGDFEVPGRVGDMTRYFGVGVFRMRSATWTFWLVDAVFSIRLRSLGCNIILPTTLKASRHQSWMHTHELAKESTLCYDLKSFAIVSLTLL